jgi:hypothetical protein
MVSNLVHVTVRGRERVSDNVPAFVHCLDLLPYVTGFLSKHTTGASSLLAGLAPAVNVRGSVTEQFPTQRL